MKKKMLIAAGVVLVLAAAVLVLLWQAADRGYGSSVGRCVVTRSGDYLLIDDTGPITMSDRSEGKDLFEGLRTGDKILILHDGICESYPGQTGVYGCTLLERGTLEDVPAQILMDLGAMGWIEESGVNEAETVAVCGAMSLQLPEGWEYEVLEQTGERDYYGIAFRPTGCEGEVIFACYPGGFGVCGTGLKEEAVTVAGFEALKGTYDNAPVWDFISLRNAPGDYVFLNRGTAQWWDQFGAAAMYIIQTAKIEQ